MLTLAPLAAVCIVPPVNVPAVHEPRSAFTDDRLLTFISVAVTLLAAIWSTVIVSAAICVAETVLAEMIPPSINVVAPV